MTIDTEIIRNAAATLDAVTSKLPADHPLRMEAAEGAKGAVSDLYRVADEIDVQAAEIADAKGQIEYLDRQNDRLREALLWTAGTLNNLVTERHIAEDDLIVMGGEPNTVGQILDAADAALAQEKS